MPRAAASTLHVRAMRSPNVSLVVVWLAAALLLCVLWAFGLKLNGDIDDLLKAREVRFLLYSGDIFNRTLPGILQPEPFTSHWPWIVDLPYVLVALILRPLAGVERAISAAFFIVPLLLLAPTLFFMRKIFEVLGFAKPALVLSIATIVGFGALAEFEPGRIDYHNIQMMLLMALVWLTIIPGRRAALASGVVASLALAVGLELTLFLLLAFAIRAFDFVARGADAGRQLQAFGIGLAASALVLFVAVVSPYDYGHPLCDRYSSPFALSLIAAGASFALIPAILSHANPLSRALGLLICGAISAGALAALFPHCLDGPYGAMPDYVRRHFLDHIDQESSLFGRPDFVLSDRMLYLGLLLVGALAAGVAAWTRRWRDRAWTVYCLFAILAVAHAILYFRFTRFLPLLTGGGVVFALYATLPAETAAKYISRAAKPAYRALPILPGLILSLALVGYHLVRETPAEGAEGVEIAGTCADQPLEGYRWPQGSRVLAPPLLGLKLLSGTGLSVIAIPFHPGSAGIERALRFLDPATPDPIKIASQAQATHVAVCAWRNAPSAQLEEEFPLAMGLAEGKPPTWLTECPQREDAPLRVYRLANGEAGSADCPVELPAE